MLLTKAIFRCVTAGALGALFNYFNKCITLYRKKNLNAFKWKRMVELCTITLIMSFISFILPLCWQVCTPIPEDGPYTTNQEEELYLKLVQFQCEPGHYNQLASLYFTSGDTAMRQLYHFREHDGEKQNLKY